MQCQILLLRKKKEEKHILKCCLLKFLPSMQSERDALCGRIRIAT